MNTFPYKHICWDGCVPRILGNYEVKTIAKQADCDFCDGKDVSCGYVYKEAPIKLRPQDSTCAHDPTRTSSSSCLPGSTRR